MSDGLTDLMDNTSEDDPTNSRQYLRQPRGWGLTFKMTARQR
jgi:hypothetical protein